ncbi:MAG: DUF4395 domain-containing protein [Desulfobacteraceae bacterium]|nr:DUF4395 domain-containing protein [Desulfobacteraceae bacterium]
MIFYQPVSISKGSFAFCRWSLTAIVWAGFLFQSKALIALSFFLLLFSAILTIKYAPLIQLFTLLEHLLSFPKQIIMLDKKSMRFAHGLGSILSGLCLILLYLDFKFAWECVLVFAIMKSISAFGICPAEKLYNCIHDNNCCSFIRRRQK